ncbi:ComEC family competence protein [bacterium]|nr:ComEC family competence protein [bacterium]
MKDWIRAQYQNAFLWAPFLMTAGAGAYFTLANNVCGVLCGAAATIACMGIIFKNKYVFRGAGLFLFGFLYTILFTHIFATPQIWRPTRNTEITGRVTSIDYSTDKTRIFLSIPRDVIKSGVHGNATVRLNIKDDMPIPNIGDKINATASIFPPAIADAPETFDYARWAYFNNLSGTGYITDMQIIRHDNAGGITKLRDRLHHAANSFLSDGLVLGYKGTLPSDDRETWTTIGIGHVWAISGFHMTLVSTWFFLIFFAIFRRIPYITRRVPARIPALICAWFGLLMYLLISGMSVATVRAFLMATLIFSAFIIGRTALSMRNICLVFCAIFLINPHYIMQPGFQLSFSAVFGLIWFWSQYRPARRQTRIGRTVFAIYAAAMTSIVATIFTAPFVAMHFYAMPMYGLIGNLILLPIFSFAIMPLVFIGTFIAALGWHGPICLAHHVYTFTLDIAQEIVDLPHANIAMPHIPNVAVAIIIFGFLCLMFIRNTENARRIMRGLRYYIFIACVATGIYIIATAPRPVFYATADHELIAFVENGKLIFSKSYASGHFFTFDTWRQLNGEPVGTPPIKRKAERGVWMYKSENFTVVYIQRFKPLSREIVNMCRDDNIDYIVSYFDVQSPKCNHKILRGGFVIYPDGHVRQSFIPRPWNNPQK